jgi:hypothetical protein
MKPIKENLRRCFIPSKEGRRAGENTAAGAPPGKENRCASVVNFCSVETLTKTQASFRMNVPVIDEPRDLCETVPPWLFWLWVKSDGRNSRPSVIQSESN